MFLRYIRTWKICIWKLANPQFPLYPELHQSLLGEQYISSVRPACPKPQCLRAQAQGSTSKGRCSWGCARGFAAHCDGEDFGGIMLCWLLEKTKKVRHSPDTKGSENYWRGQEELTWRTWWHRKEMLRTPRNRHCMSAGGQGLRRQGHTWRMVRLTQASRGHCTPGHEGEDPQDTWRRSSWLHLQFACVLGLHVCYICGGRSRSSLCMLFGPVSQNP